MLNFLSLSCALFLLLISCSAVELTVEHSLDGGVTFKKAGVLEGNFKLRDLKFSRDSLSPADAAQLAALVKADKFYTLRAVGSTTSVHASCFAAPADEVEERVQLVLGSAATPLFFNYIVLEHSCSLPTLRWTGSDGKCLYSKFKGCAHNISGTVLKERVQMALAPLGALLFFKCAVLSPGCHNSSPTTPPHLKSVQIDVDVEPPTMGPVMYNLFEQAGIDAAPGSGPAGYGGPQDASGRSGGKMGAKNRPLGTLPNQPSSDQAAGDKEPPSWVSKNWMFILGGAMVLVNLVSTVGRLANAPAGTSAPSRGR